MTDLNLPEKDSPKARSEREKYWVCRVSSEKTLAHLLRLEKERRRLRPDCRCFVGMSDLASYDRRTDERAYFSAYLLDGSICASKLRLISRRPTLQRDWLAIVPQPSFEDRQRLSIEERKPPRRRPAYLIDRFGREYPVNDALIADYLGGRIEVGGWGFSSVPHELKPSTINASEKRAAEGRLVYPKLRAHERGRLDQDLLAEQHPTFRRWHFDWREYVVVGVPDGITDDFVYE
ncbi:MAG: hypothetical protein ACREQN_14705, partial [Candidatus Binataceae bacterium]